MCIVLRLVAYAYSTFNFQEFVPDDQRSFLIHNQVLTYTLYGTYVDTFIDPQAQFEFHLGQKDLEIFHHDYSKILEMNRFVPVIARKHILPNALPEEFAAINRLVCYITHFGIVVLSKIIDGACFK